MKTCPKYEAESDDMKRFCTKCGTSLSMSMQTQQSSSNFGNTPLGGFESPPKPRLKPRYAVIVPLIVLIVAGIIVLTVYFLPSPTQAVTVSIGDMINFGGIDWRVLDIQGDRVLILSDLILERRPYHEVLESVTWEQSDIRQYLNGEFFYKTFSEAERARIVRTTVINNYSPWTFSEWGATSRTPGGNHTQDNIFLLSLDEVTRYFGGADLLELGKDERNRDGSIPGLYYWGIWEDNSISQARIARESDGDAWWWLRSPGFRSLDAASVLVGGDVLVSGRPVSVTEWGVRPALWLQL